ncbi:TRAP transporter large permease [Thermodesulfobacteriota bacterium]
MEPIYIGLIGLLIFLIVIFLGIPLPIAFLTVGVGGIVTLRGVNAALGVVKIFPFHNTAEFGLAVLPLFIMMGLIFSECGVGEEIFASIKYWLGHFPGGLAAATTAACAAIGTTTGSAAAATVLMGKVAYPEMRRFGYDKGLSVGVIASAGTIAMMIPPSLMVVVYAILAEQSVGKLLIAGFIPGVVSAAMYIGMIVIRVKLNPALGPVSEPASWKLRFSSLKYLLPVLIMFLVILGGIYFGVFTPTEAGGIGVVTAFIIVIVSKRLNWTRLKLIILDTCRMTVLVMILLLGISFMTQFLTFSEVTFAFADLALKFPSPLMTLFLMFVIYIVLGMFISGTGMVMISVPIFVPVILSLGYDPIWFGILVIKMCEVAAITPPVCIGVYIAQGVIKEVSIETAIKGTLWFLAMDFITLCLFIIFPEIITVLPNLMAG